MSDHTENSRRLSETEKESIRNMARGMSVEEIAVFLEAIDSSAMWEEMIKRERENAEKLKAISQLITSFSEGR